MSCPAKLTKSAGSKASINFALVSTRSLRVWMFSSSIVGGALLGGQVFAQATSMPPKPGDASEVGEIVVTATRQAVVLSKVPQSVSAMNQKSLDVRGIKDIAGLTRLTPGVQFDQTGFGGQSNIAIRGVNSSVGASTTGIYLDETPIQSRILGYSATNTYPSVFDLERVEVLRGPQGTLFGAGSEGGTVRFIAPSPSLSRYSVYARSELSGTKGGAGSGEAGVAVGGPIIADKLGFRISVWGRHDGGYIDRVDVNPANLAGKSEKNTNSTNTKVARLALKWAPTENLQITPSIFYQDRRAKDISTYWEEISDPSGGKLINGQPNAQPDRDKFYVAALNVEYNFANVKLTSNTSYYHRKQVGVNDYSTLLPTLFTGSIYLDQDPSYSSYADMRNSQSVATEELRLQSDDSDARLSWVAGLFLSKADQKFSEAIVDPKFAEIFGGVPPEVIFGQPLVDGQYALLGHGDGEDEQIAGFGELTYRITDQVKLTGGLRVAKTSFEGGSFFTGPFSGTVLQTPSKSTEKPVTPRVTLSYQINDDNLVYGSASKGYRIGGANAPVTAAACTADLAANGFSAVPPTYQSDSLWNYEVGSKNKFFERRLEISVSAYHIDWSNIQQLVYLTNCGAQFVANLGKVKIDGFDLQATFRPARGLTLEATAGYTDAKFARDIPGASKNIVSKGDHLDTHPWSATLAATYETELAGRYNLYLRGDYQYKSRSRMVSQLDPTTTNYDPTAIPADANNFVTLRGGVRLDGYDLSVFVDNLTDSHPRLTRYNEVVAGPINRVATFRPRTIGLTATYRY